MMALAGMTLELDWSFNEISRFSWALAVLKLWMYVSIALYESLAFSQTQPARNSDFRRVD
jgi:hypothetical protein